VVTNIFLYSVGIAWFAFLFVPYLLIGWFTPIDPFGGGILSALFVILSVVSACVGAGVYYVVGRKVLILLRLWDEAAFERSQQFTKRRR
jgi:hypothetical protein